MFDHHPRDGHVPVRHTPNLEIPRRRRRGIGRQLTQGLALALVASLSPLAGVGAAQALISTVPPLENPAMPERCNLDLAISLDLSSSITNTQFTKMKAGVTALAESLSGSSVRVALHNFASRAPATTGKPNQPLPLTPLDEAGVRTVANAVQSISRPSSSLGATNWDRAFAAVADSPEAYDAVLFVTDGEPTVFGSQTAGSRPSVANVTAAVESANRLKGLGTRIVGVGMMDNVRDRQQFDEHMSQISGPVVGNDYLASNFDGLSELLLGYLEASCTASTAIDLVKTASLPDGSLGEVGDTVTYDFTATNIGGTTLGGVEITDPMPGLGDVNYDWPDETHPQVLARGDSVTAQAQYEITLQDRLTGFIENTAGVTGTPAEGEPVTAQDSARLVLPDVPIPPSITVEKTGTLDGTGNLGDPVTYEFTVTNTGGTKLSDIAITDAMVDEVTLTGPNAESRELAPGEAFEASASYQLTQTDLDAGQVTNIATATGTPPGGEPVTSKEASSTITFESPAAITLGVEVQLKDEATAGDPLTYTFAATNTGRVTLSEVEFSSAHEGLSDIAIANTAWPDAVGRLAPGESVVGTASYELRRDDVDRGDVTNVTTTSGTSPQNTIVSDTQKTVTPVTAQPGITLSKSGKLVDDSTVQAGDLAEYTFTVKNTGNVTLTQIEISDQLVGSVDWPADWNGTLAAGETVTATAQYALSQEDLNAGTVINDASVTATAPNGAEVSDSDSNDLRLPQLPAISLTKTGVLEGEARLDDPVRYSFVVHNTGNLTITAVEITDELLGASRVHFGDWPEVEGVLQPGGQVTATAEYALTQADLDANTVTNTATATGLDPRQNQVTDTASTTLPLGAGPALELQKLGVLDRGAGSMPGDTVSYTFVATNIGQVSLTELAITDRLAGVTKLVYAWPGEPGALAPGESVTATASYVLTQADFDAGSVANAARVTGSAPDGALAEASAEVSTPLPWLAAMELTKSGTLSGDQIRYTIVVTNTGNVTLTGVEITDKLAGLSQLTLESGPGEASVLAPGEQLTATASYRVTAADRERGEVRNLASVVGIPTSGDPIRTTDKDHTRVDTLAVTGAPPAPLSANLAAAGGLLLLGGTLLMLRKRRIALSAEADTATP